MPTRHPAHLTALLVLAGAALPAAAQTSPWYVGASQGFTYDSNLYRADSDRDLNRNRAPGLPPLSRSDTISSTSLVAGLDQPIGRQRVFGSALVSANRFKNNDQLNGSSYRLSGGLDWSTIERFSGNLNLLASQDQRQFDQQTLIGGVQTEKNDESVEQLDATFRVGVVTRLTVEAGFGYRQVGYSADAFAGSEYSQPSASIGLRYRPGIATFGASYRHADSRYDEAASARLNDRTRDSLDLTVSWPVSGASSLFLRLSPTWIRYDEFNDRDFTGLTGALRWDWRPTGKLKLATRLVSDTGQDSRFESFGAAPEDTRTSSTSRTTTTLRLNADYEASSKILLTTGVGSAYRDFSSSDSLRDDGSDLTNSFSLGARWTPLRSVQVGCDLTLEKRSVKGNSNRDAYSADTINCFGQFTIQ
jgi:hypothetical protein